VHEIVHKTISLVQDSAQKKNITILSSTSPEDLAFEADYNMLYTILRNLITNAIKYTPDQGRITVTGRQENKSILLMVEDNGVGMDDNTIKSLIKINDQHSLSGTDNEQGTGLGLILCKEFIDKHKGEISVVSTPGKGSTFLVKLPITLK